MHLLDFTVVRKQARTIQKPRTLPEVISASIAPASTWTGYCTETIRGMESKGGCLKVTMPTICFVCMDGSGYMDTGTHKSFDQASLF